MWLVNNILLSTVSEWLKNRQAFFGRINELKEKGAKGVQGRAPEGYKKGREIRKILLDKYRFKLLKENVHLEHNEPELERLLKEYGDSKAVIDIVDAIAGGQGQILMKQNWVMLLSISH